MNTRGLKPGVRSERYRRLDLKREALILKTKMFTLFGQYRERSIGNLSHFIADVKRLQAIGGVDAEYAREAMRSLDFAEWILARSSGP